jgi:predicted RNase H-like HicB family nuclease
LKNKIFYKKNNHNIKGEKLLKGMIYKVCIIIEKDEYGYYAYCPELEGCQTQGESLEEVLSNIKEAIELYLETLSEDEIRDFLSRVILTTSLEVKVG